MNKYFLDFNYLPYTVLIALSAIKINCYLLNHDETISFYLPDTTPTFLIEFYPNYSFLANLWLYLIDLLLALNFQTPFT